MTTIIEMQTLLIAGTMAVIAVVWLAAAIAIYKLLRRLIVGSPGSAARRVLFTLVCGTIVAPGLLSFGHPPPIPSPGAAPLGLAYLSELLRGHRSEDSFFFGSSGNRVGKSIGKYGWKPHEYWLAGVS